MKKTIMALHIIALYSIIAHGAWWSDASREYVVITSSEYVLLTDIYNTLNDDFFIEKYAKSDMGAINKMSKFRSIIVNAQTFRIEGNLRARLCNAYSNTPEPTKDEMQKTIDALNRRISMLEESLGGFMSIDTKMRLNKLKEGL